MLQSVILIKTQEELMSSKSKSERKTIFISLLDADAYEADQLAKALESTGIGEDYRPIITAKPLQALSKEEALEVLRHIAEVDGDEEDERTKRIARSLSATQNGLEGVRQEIVALKDTQKDMQNALNSYGSMISQYTNGVMPPYVNGRTSSGEYGLSNAIQTLRENAPKEGEKW